MRRLPALTIDDARELMSACRNAAQAGGWQVSIVIVDSAGAVLLAERLQSRGFTMEVALGKARTAAKLQQPSGAIAARIKDMPGLMALDIVPLQGALPLVAGDHCVGAIGVSGVAAADDEKIAAAGVAVFARLSGV
ncbi:MAG: heme-binding protein [Steroidobacteraceae bacterium]